MNNNQPSPNPMIVLTGGIRAEKKVLESAVQYAAKYSSYVAFPADGTSSFFKRWGASFLRNQPEETRRRIYLVESYTCLEVTQFLEEMASRRQETGGFFGFDFLATFYDDIVTFHEARGLLDLSIQFLKMIRLHAPVMIHAEKPKSSSRRQSFFQELTDQADRVADENFGELDWLGG